MDHPAGDPRPEAWRIGDGERLKLHFGAVDYQAKVYVNSIQVATHKGGHDGFTADITKAVTGSGLQEVIVGVEDRADATWQPVGKQRLTPDRGIFYTGASGIWQTVWIEPVARGFVTDLDMTTDVDTNTRRRQPGRHRRQLQRLGMGQARRGWWRFPDRGEPRHRRRERVLSAVLRRGPAVGFQLRRTARAVS